MPKKLRQITVVLQSEAAEIVEAADAGDPEAKFLFRAIRRLVVKIGKADPANPAVCCSCGVRLTHETHYDCAITLDLDCAVAFCPECGQGDRQLIQEKAVALFHLIDCIRTRRFQGFLPARRSLRPKRRKPEAPPGQCFCYVRDERHRGPLRLVTMPIEFATDLYFSGEA